MAINVSEALDLDTAVIVTVERKTGGAYVNGLWVPGSTVTFKTLASPQQPTPRQLQVIPEGERNQDIRLFYCKKVVRTASDKDQLEADVILHKGLRFRVMQLADWGTFGHTIAFGAREQ